MFRAARMKRADVLVLERDLDAVTTELGRLGMLHLEQARLPDGEGLVHPTDTRADLDRLEALAGRVDALAARLGIAPQDTDAAVTLPNVEEIDQRLTRLQDQVAALIQRRDAGAAEEARLVDLAERLEPFEAVDIPTRQIEDLDFLHFAVGTVPAGQVRGLLREVRDDVVVVPAGSAREDRDRLIAVSSKKGRWALQTALEASQFHPDERPEGTEVGPAEAMAAVRERLHQVRGDLAAIGSELDDLRRRHGPALRQYARQLAIGRRVLAAQGMFGRTESACLISGWVPSTRAEALQRRVDRSAAGRAVVEFCDPADLGPLDREPPVLLSNHPLLRPFEVLVSGYGTPTYTEIEPTAFVAVTYLTMFGLMFGDVGQGAVLALVGVLVHRRARGRAIRDVGALMGYAGVSAALFGGVYNSVFGKEGVLPWRPLLAPLAVGRHVQVLLGITLGFGILVITLGTLINIINRLSRRDFLGGVLNRFGLMGMVIYWGAIGLGIKALVFGAAVRGWEIGLFIVLPLVLLFFKEPLYALLTHKHKLYHEGLFNGLMEAGVEILETFSAFLANTLSFLRVGAFALAHAGLCVGIFEIERVVRGSGGVGRTVASILAVALGNAIIIGLEGLVVGIQAVRLEYYEFMSRFFRGTGRAYRPFEIGEERGHDTATGTARPEQTAS